MNKNLKINNIIVLIIIILSIVFYFMGYKDLVIVPIIYLLFNIYLLLNKNNSSKDN